MNHFHLNSEPDGTVLQKSFTMRARSSSPDVTSQTLRRMPPQSIYMYLPIAAQGIRSRRLYFKWSSVLCSHAKSRVAPLVELTLPQLRLLAAFVGARLANFVSSALKSRYPNLKVKLWSDSEIVLHWLYSNKQLKLFIGNRTGEIKSLFPLSAWNHCPTNENPAHLLTRGTNTTQLHSSALWTHGPYWLPFESQWPSWNPSQVLHIDSSNAVDSETTADESTQQNQRRRIFMSLMYPATAH